MCVNENLPNKRIYQQGLYLNYCLWKTEICPKMVANSNVSVILVILPVPVLVIVSVGFEGERVWVEVVSLTEEYSELFVSKL